MNFDTYAQHLVQKYRLAVAIGVIETKPEAKTLNQHITDLKNKIIDDKMDDMTICSDDFDMEFNDMVDLDDQIVTSQQSQTILKDFNDEHILENYEFGRTSVENIYGSVVNFSEVQQQNDEQSTFCETQAQSSHQVYTTRDSLTDIDKTFCNSIALLNQNEIIAIDKACNNITKPNEIQTTIDKTTFKNIQKNQMLDNVETYCNSLVKTNKHKTVNMENTFCENVTNINNREQNTKEITNTDIDRQYLDRTTVFDSQATELYTLHTLTEDYTHVSQSQNNNFDISNRFIKGITQGNGNKDTSICVTDNLPTHVVGTEFGKNIKDIYLMKKINKNVCKFGNMKGETHNCVENTQTTTEKSGYENRNNNLEENTEFGYNFKDINLIKKIHKKLHKNNITMVENIEHKTQTVTDVRNARNIEVNDKEIMHNLEVNDTNTEFEYILKDNNLARKVCNNLDKDNFSNISMELDADKFDMHSQADLNTNNFKQNNEFTQETQCPFAEKNSEQILLNLLENNNSQNTAHAISRNNNESMTMQVHNLSENDQNAFLRNEINKTALNTVKDLSKPNVPNTENMTMQFFDLSQVKPVEDDNITNAEKSKTNIQNTETVTMQVFDPNQNIQNPSNNKNVNNDIENESVSSEELSELVPFKVMEEFNRVKAYLNRRIERRMSTDLSLDSGYRSDSQGRSKSAGQLSANWIGQSAYCLYEHITRCPMVTTTQEMVKEISQVLGQLIDRLHEEESYPAFLEELLDHVNTLIQSIFTEEDMLLEKDEKIQRLFLLNESIHIQKYSIEKLTDILEKIYTNLTTKEELYELTNIQDVENMSYIFHILEVTIKKYLKTKKIEDTQTQSQENYPKKSSISDIWRKKWNPNYKEETKLASSLDKKCIFTKCSEVLNKIVVGCLDGYSLVAYAALQCFNLLQFQ